MPVIEIDEGEFAAIAHELGAIEPQVRRAFADAINRVAASLSTRFATELAQESGIKLSAFRGNRVFASKARAASEKPRASIWVGVDTVSLRHYRVRKAADGIVAMLGGARGNVPIRHAFTTGKFGGNVFVRRKYLPELPAGIVDSGNSFGMRGVARLGYSWGGTAHGARVLEASAAAASARLPVEFESRLRHYVEAKMFGGK